MVLTVLYFHKFIFSYISEIIQDMSFCVWLISLGNKHICMKQNSLTYSCGFSAPFSTYSRSLSHKYKYTCMCVCVCVHICRLPQWYSGKESICNAGATGDMGSIPGSGRSLEEEMATHAYILAWRIPQRRLAGDSP